MSNPDENIFLWSLRKFWYNKIENSSSERSETLPVHGAKKSQKKQDFENLIKMQFAMKIKEKYKQITKKTLFLNKFSNGAKHSPSALS